MTIKPHPTQERLKELLHYDHETGIFTWIVERSRFKAGKRAGCIHPHGYVRIHIDSKLYGAHRLAWIYVYGENPTLNVDHINGDPSDNRISNLRLSTVSQNAQNLKADRPFTQSGLLGVYFKKNGYESSIQVAGKSIYLGRFKTAEDAHSAYLEAKRKFHPFGTL